MINPGGGTLNWTIASDKSWLSGSPTSGDTTTEMDSVTVTADLNGLSAGIYSGTLTVTNTAASNSPQTIAVTLTLSTEPGLVAHWKFDEGSGTVAADSSGLSNHGTLQNGASWTSGKIVGGLRFDGSNDRVRVP